MPASDRTEGAKECAVRIRRVVWDVLVLADRHLGKSKRGRIYGLAGQVTDQGVPTEVTRDLRVIRRAQPEGGRRLDAIAPLVGGDEERADDRRHVGRIG